MLEAILAFDTKLFLLLNSAIANPVFDVIYPIFDEQNNWIIPGLVVAAFFIRRERKKALIALGLLVLVILIADPLCARIIKPLVGRLRPCHPDVLVEGGRFLKGHRASLSFPSCHAMNMYAGAMLITLLYPKNGSWLLAIAALRGYARIYLGVHYPSDVLAGAVFGMLVALGVYFVYRSIKKPPWLQGF